MQRCSGVKPAGCDDCFYQVDREILKEPHLKSVAELIEM